MGEDTSFVGGSFVRFVPPGPDCINSNVTVPVALLKCFDFTLPDFVAEADALALVDASINGPLATTMNFTNQDKACGGQDLKSRLSTVYDLPLIDVQLGTTTNTTEGSALDPHLISSISASFFFVTDTGSPECNA
ncbi:hypothetical protein HDU99_010856, partial [Rhizoclosmatium hyalinum]